ncbi:hypothetical protein FT663_05055 [Candidozyma haemuli var. vulneris]|uniref:SWIRM domain-containing protein n=1 Tax=Candidozyma haemuli TaxID=45357 RepID=A0A2V1AMR2_9ASCO|nr:hypothetical protein CXQ85_003199 [[Candida] haemuloni]KAF3985467.1 hypothetical protein FT662_05137 [[Candida] haemuloni var. vulneris]KAF3986036.1 hypothetical protein FT663_05055 [[Candida] haemuloni var. vulneris]PVH19360.1 hypothetical protein CXQ85_003199 [[Candida] haemuloni]
MSDAEQTPLSPSNNNQDKAANEELSLTDNSDNIDNIDNALGDSNQDDNLDPSLDPMLDPTLDDNLDDGLQNMTSEPNEFFDMDIDSKDDSPDGDKQLQELPENTSENADDAVFDTADLENPEDEKSEDVENLDKANEDANMDVDSSVKDSESATAEQDDTEKDDAKDEEKSDEKVEEKDDEKDDEKEKPKEDVPEKSSVSPSETTPIPSTETDSVSKPATATDSNTEGDEKVTESRKSAPRIEDDEPEIKKEQSATVEKHESDSEVEEDVFDQKLGDSSGLDTDDKSRIRQTHAIIIPSYASWFNMKKIHQIERDSLPEFFNTSHPSKSPKIYANYRNFMINVYRLNPNEYLTLTSCRRNLVGDVGTIMRVHRFLTKWGLINYQVNPQLKPAYALEKLPNGSSVGLPYTGDFHVQYDTPRGLFPFDTFKVNTENVNAEKLKALLGSEKGINGSSDHAESQNDDLGLDIEPSQKKRKIETAVDDNWSTEELSSLVLGIKEHRNDWYKIAKKVGNDKTPQECILKFLGMPLEDRFNALDSKDDSIIKYAANFPVSSTDNPVIGNLVFMTNLVDSDVVRAATKRASDKLDEKFFERIEKTQSVSGKEGSDEKKESTESNGSANPESIDPALEDDLKQVFNTSESSENIKDAAAGVLGTVGGRSHLFANYEEREMQRLTSSILNNELTKLDVKMNKVNELEKIFQRERSNLSRLQNEIFCDRLALTRSTVSISKKLNDALELLKSSKEGEATPGDKVQNIESIIKEAQSLLYKPTVSAFDDKDSKQESQSRSEDTDAKTQNSESTVKPLSIETPQSFKVWVP